MLGEYWMTSIASGLARGALTMVERHVSTLLTSHGYQVEHYPLGKTGFERFCQEPQSWDAVILDLELPDISGQDLIPQIAVQCPNLPIVVFSGQKGLQDSFKLYSSGASALFSKPFFGYNLLDVVSRLTELPPTTVQRTLALLVVDPALVLWGRASLPLPQQGDREALLI
jgi:FixJ family two-component response regulator